jgi:hypothetical protein
VVINDSVAAKLGWMLMLAGKQEDLSRRMAVGADKAYNAKDFVIATRALNVARHITKNEKGRGPNLDGRTTRRPVRHQPDLPPAGREGVQPAKPSIVLKPMVIIRQVVAKCPKRE